MMQDAAVAVDAPDPLAVFKSHELRLVPESGGLLEKLFFRAAGQNEQAVMTDGLFLLIFWFSVFFFVLLMGLMVYWVIKYRRRPGVPAPLSAPHNGPLEIFWTVVPSSALLVIFLAGFWGYMSKVVAPADALRLNVTGFKWDWEVVYPGGEKPAYTMPLGTKDAVKIIVLPENSPVQLLLKSNDVIHAFWVPDYRTKMDLYPNRLTTYTFHTEKLADDEVYRDHWVFCAEYCGQSHSEMYAIIRVVRQNDYEAILADWNTGSLSCEELGELVYRTNCVSCHTVDGSPGIGPTWLGSFGTMRALENGQQVLMDENYIRESILYPEAKRVAGFAGQNMTAFLGLSEDEIAGVICYIRSLSEQGQDTPEGEEAPGDGAGTKGDSADG
ncbi:MAG: cytochrome c oxidase subunit II [Planctomycetota bacterium]|nr:MAG: cytochrome c oxidase subunit II [Planctomycetota bacterium]